MAELQASVSTAGGGGSFNENSEGKTTPRKFDVGQDARGMESGGQYPNYWSHKTRSGHSFIMDDSQGNETVTIQHRSGTALQMRADGGMLITTHNGKYEVVLGEERVTISGASDITVKGDTSLRCYGDYNVTVHKDYNLTVLGNMNMTAKNLNRSIRGTMDTEAKTVNKRVEGSTTINSGGAQAFLSRDDTSIASTGKGKVQIAAAEGDLSVSALGSKANMLIESKNKMFQVSTNDYNAKFGSAQSYGAGSGGSGSSTPTYQINVTKSGVKRKTKGNHNHEITSGDKTTKVSGNYNVNSTGGNISGKADGGSIQYQASQDIIHKASSNFQATAGSSLDIRAPSGQATFAGASTVINALSGALGIAGSSGISLDSLGSLLNLNSGIASIVSALGLNLNFDFGQSGDAEDAPPMKGSQANQPTQEQDATSETDSWL
jgi:hypothetical protein